MIHSFAARISTGRADSIRHLQGYLLSRAVPGDQIVPLLPVLAERARKLLLTSRERPSSLAASVNPVLTKRQHSAA